MKKLTFWYVASFLVVFVVFTALAGLIFWRILNSQIDHHLHTSLTEAERIWQQAPDNRRELITGLAGSQGMVVIVMAPDGEILLETASPEIVVPAQHKLQQHVVMVKQGQSTPHHFKIDSLSFALTTTRMAAGEGSLAVGYSTAVLQETFRRALIFLAGLIIALVIALGALGYFLSERSLLAQLQRVVKVQKQFLADAAHTLKSPLAAIQVQLNEDDDRHSKILASVTRAREIIDDLLYLSRIETEEVFKKETINLTAALKEVCEVARPLAQEKRLELRCEIEDNLRVVGDRAKLTRAVLNAVENAIRYSQKARSGTPDGWVLLSARRTRGWVAVRVIDSGVGIAREDLEKVFERFYRGRNVKNLSGTGLGLAITKAVIEAHGGSVTIESREGKGTQVEIKVPSA